MCTVRYVGRFLVDDPLDVPWSVVEHLAARLGIEDLSCVKRYTERVKRAYEREIRDAYGHHPIEDAEGAGSSGRCCSAGRGQAPRGRWRCSTGRWGGYGATGCCWRVSRCRSSRSPRCGRGEAAVRHGRGCRAAGGRVVVGGSGGAARCAAGAQGLGAGAAAPAADAHDGHGLGPLGSAAPSCDLHGGRWGGLPVHGYVVLSRPRRYPS